jgi:hypothetical protein
MMTGAGTAPSSEGPSRLKDVSSGVAGKSLGPMTVSSSPSLLVSSLLLLLTIADDVGALKAPHWLGVLEFLINVFFGAEGCKPGTPRGKTECSNIDRIQGNGFDELATFPK